VFGRGNIDLIFDEDGLNLRIRTERERAFGADGLGANARTSNRKTLSVLWRRAFEHWQASSTSRA
jgi:hypothetical protein